MKLPIATTVALLVLIVFLGGRQRNQITELEKETIKEASPMLSTRLRIGSRRVSNGSISEITDEVVEIYSANEQSSNPDRARTEAEFKEAMISLSMRELEGIFRFNDAVLRHLTVRRQEADARSITD